MKRFNIIENILIENRYARIVEVGVLKGQTLRYILQSECKNFITDYWAVDPWPHQHGGDPRHRQVCRFIPFFPQLRIIRLTSVEAAQLLNNKYLSRGYLDFGFIDADHSYESVKEDISVWLPHIRAGGMLTGHDYGRRYPGVKKAVDEVFGIDNIEVINEVWIKRIDK